MASANPAGAVSFGMTDASALYSAYAARDARFDGIFFIGVTSTGIYCRPVCSAKTPRRANCRFFDSAEAAEKASFRPCLRCRPELAPGNAPVDDARRIAHLVAHRIDEGLLDEGGGLEALAARFGWSSRQIRRMVQRELGVSPIELVLTRRLLLAKQLLTETALPITEIAHASGFGSLRRFNDAFRRRYGMPPGRLRRATGSARDTGSLTLQLTYRPPYDWAAMLAFLGARAVPGVEAVRGDRWIRTIRLGAHAGWLEVRHLPERNALLVELSQSLTPVLPPLLGRLRNLFDLAARPDVIADHLAADPLLASAIAAHPGLRVPGALDGTEIGVRAILGQQVSVRSATSAATRLAEAFGERIYTPFPELDRLWPVTATLATLESGALRSLGIIAARARAIISLAQAVTRGAIELEPGVAPEEQVSGLESLPGIGPWTASYIAMRALRWPDAFPSGDVIVRKRLGGIAPSEVEARAERWRPWRSYAVLHLWLGSGAEGTSTG
jgi:AraC family transcriptional regulator of adaptative response / DNA-3-methyladenine glycosylase II